MESAGAQVARQARLGLEHRDGNALARQAERGDQPDRAGADDDDGLAVQGQAAWSGSSTACAALSVTQAVAKYLICGSMP